MGKTNLIIKSMVMQDIDSVPSREALLYAFEDNEAVIKNDL